MHSQFKNRKSLQKKIYCNEGVLHDAIHFNLAEPEKTSNKIFRFMPYMVLLLILNKPFAILNLMLIKMFRLLYVQLELKFSRH
jgi:hypothetical protein